MDKLKGFIDEYYKILELKGAQRTLLLSSLMDDMQQEYNIPLINNKAFNNKNKAVIQLYKEVSPSRNI